MPLKEEEYKHNAIKIVSKRTTGNVKVSSRNIPDLSADSVNSKLSIGRIPMKTIYKPQKLQYNHKKLKTMG